jgi:hypothetical protein
VTPYGLYRTNFEGWGFHYTRLYNGTFFEICLGSTAPRLAGSEDEVVFYNTETSTFNSIQVEDVYNYSDRRAKTNIVPLDTSLGKIMKLKPVSYNWKDPKGGVKMLKSGTAKTDLGFVAQDVEQVIPDAVFTDDQGRKLLNYPAIVSVLTKSVQELTRQVEALKVQVAELKKQATTAANE